MKVGVVADVPSSHAGGASTLLSTLLTALNNLDTNHSFVRLDPAKNVQKTPIGAHHSSEASKFSGFARLFRGALIPSWLGSAISQGVRQFSKPKRDNLATLDEKIKAERVDIVWFMNPPGAIVSVPFITTVWDLAHRNMPYFPEVSITGYTWEAREHAFRSVLPRSSIVLTGTNAGKAEIVQYYGLNPDNVKVAPFPVPSASCKPTLEHLESVRTKYSIPETFLLYPAQFWPHKNHVNLLFALKVLQRGYGLTPGMVFTGSDKGNCAHVQSVVLQLGLSDQVRNLGFVERSDLDALYSSATALVFPSFFGPDNIPPLEAFALRCPVIAAQVNGADEQLGEAALLFDPADPKNIATVIHTVINDPGLRERLRHMGDTIATTRTPKSYLARIIEILDDFERVRRCWGQEYRHT